jgi:YfiH family protein
MLQAIHCADAKLVRLHQVHGAAIFDARHASHTSCKGDGLISDDPDLAISIRTADCVPVLMSSSDGRTVAANHSGWRGGVAGVVPNAIDALRAKNAPLPILAAIGPCIGFEAFEVGPEVLEQFEERFGANGLLRRRPDGKGYVDLRSAIRRQLIDKGITEDAIDTTDRCSFRDKNEFFSHRRENGLTGRMISLIAARPM